MLDHQPHDFFNRVVQLSGEDIQACFQCGVCSSACPLSHHMDLSPSTILREIQLGIEHVLDSRAIWICSTCFTCLARCPRGIDLARITEALRQMNLRRKGDHVNISQIPKAELDRLPQIALVSVLRKKSA